MRRSSQDRTLFLGGGSAVGQFFGTGIIQPRQRLLLLLVGLFLIILNVLDQPVGLWQIFGIVLGAFTIFSALAGPRLSAPYYLSFDEKGLHGHLSEWGRFSLLWREVNRIDHSKGNLVVYTETRGSTTIGLKDVDIKQKAKVLPELMKEAREHHVRVG